MVRFQKKPVVNVHMHHLTAKKETGFAKVHEHLFDTLASCIVENKARIVAGDFNMPLWVVAGFLRDRGIECNLGAWYAWKHKPSEQIRVDSCGILLRQGAQGAVYISANCFRGWLRAARAQRRPWI